MPRTTPENAVQRAVVDLLNAERIWWRRQQSRTFRVPGTGGRERLLFVGSLGMADILATPLRIIEVEVGSTVNHRRVPQLLWIETKGPNGKQSQHQKFFQEEVEQVGHFYLLARSSDDVLEWLRRNR